MVSCYSIEWPSRQVKSNDKTAHLVTVLSSHPSELSHAQRRSTPHEGGTGTIGPTRSKHRACASASAMFAWLSRFCNIRDIRIRFRSGLTPCFAFRRGATADYVSVREVVQVAAILPFCILDNEPVQRWPGLTSGVAYTGVRAWFIMTYIGRNLRMIYQSRGSWAGSHCDI